LFYYSLNVFQSILSSLFLRTKDNISCIFDGRKELGVIKISNKDVILITNEKEIKLGDSWSGRSSKLESTSIDWIS
jgi:hypothetical protein